MVIDEESDIIVAPAMGLHSASPHHLDGGRRRCLIEAECTVSGGYAKNPKIVIFAQTL